VGSKRGLGEGADRALDSDSADPVEHEAATMCTERDPRYVGSCVFGLQQLGRWLCMSYSTADVRHVLLPNICDARWNHL